jgi:hypothetical protein
VWTLTTGFASPESAFYDTASNAVFVSSINGQILDKDGNGYISRLSPDGKWWPRSGRPGSTRRRGCAARAASCMPPTSTPWWASTSRAGKKSRASKIDGAVFLNDLATAPDGTIYVSDSTALKIFEVRNGTASVFVEGGNQVEQPNGLLVDGGRLILGSVGPAPVPGAPRGGGAGRGSVAGHLFAFDRKSKQRTLLTAEPVGGIDGIELDGRGGLIVTDVIGQRLLHVSKAGKVTALAKFTAGGPTSATYRRRSARSCRSSPRTASPPTTWLRA